MQNRKVLEEEEEEEEGKVVPEDERQHRLQREVDRIRPSNWMISRPKG